MQFFFRHKNDLILENSMYFILTKQYKSLIATEIDIHNFFAITSVKRSSVVVVVVSSSSCSYPIGAIPVSYTHLDVYKRQGDIAWLFRFFSSCFLFWNTQIFSSSIVFDENGDKNSFNSSRSPSLRCRWRRRHTRSVEDITTTNTCLLYTSRCV